jgi:hypothetical protein
MAINFLNTVDLNQNELNNATIQNVGTDPILGVLGQIIFNTTSKTLKTCTTASDSTANPAVNAIFSGSEAGVSSVTTTDSTFINLTPNTASTGAVTVTAELSAADDVPAAGTRFLAKDNKWRVPSASANTTYDLTGSGGANGTAAITLSGSDLVQTNVVITGTGATTVVRAGNTLTVNSANTDTQETYTLPVSAGTAVTGFSVADIELTAAGASTGIKSKVTFAGKNSNIAVSETAGNDGVVLLALTDSVVISTNLDVGGEISQTSAGNENTFASPLNMGSNKVTNVVDPTSAQDAATKQYVDDSVVGGLVYQGGYRADTNVPNLDTNTSIQVSKGFTYTVTAPGLFFTEQVRVGDVLISEVDQAAGASSAANWTTVQNNVDLASSTVIGIGNVVEATAVALKGTSVTYSAGTATVGLDIDAGLTEATLPANAEDILIPYFDDTSSENHKAEAKDLALVMNSKTSATGTISIGNTIGTVTHALGINTMVQTLDSNGNTVYCEISRTATTSVATINTAQTGVITILVQKIG